MWRRRGEWISASLRRQEWVGWTRTGPQPITLVICATGTDAVHQQPVRRNCTWLWEAPLVPQAVIEIPHCYLTFCMFLLECSRKKKLVSSVLHTVGEQQTPAFSFEKRLVGGHHQQRSSVNSLCNWISAPSDLELVQPSVTSTLSSTNSLTPAVAEATGIVKQPAGHVNHLPPPHKTPSEEHPNSSK